VSSVPTARRRHVRRRVACAVVALAAVGGLGLGSAARLDVAPRGVASGTAAVGDCQGALPVRVQLVSAWAGTQFTTTAVRVHGLASACAGKELRVTLVDADGASLGEAVLATIPGGTPAYHQAALPAAVATSSVAGSRVVVEG